MSFCKMQIRIKRHDFANKLALWILKLVGSQAVSFRERCEGEGILIPGIMHFIIAIFWQNWSKI